MDVCNLKNKKYIEKQVDWSHHTNMDILIKWKNVKNGNHQLQTIPHQPTYNVALCANFISQGSHLRTKHLKVITVKVDCTIVFIDMNWNLNSWVIEKYLQILFRALSEHIYFFTFLFSECEFSAEVCQCQNMCSKEDSACKEKCEEGPGRLITKPIREYLWSFCNSMCYL